MKILINTPNYLNPSLGGVANHYYGLKSYWNDTVLYNIVGSRNGKKGSGKYLILYDILKFLIKIIFYNPQIIVLNPSLAPNAIKRDLIFLKIGSYFKNVIVFFHGFNPAYADKINGKSFCQEFRKSKAFIVLSMMAKDYLKNWGIKVPIYLSTTKVDDRMIEKFDINSRQGIVKNILFLSRIEKEKGILEALAIFDIIYHKNKNIHFTVVGDGNALDDAKRYVSDKAIKNVYFTGRLMGEELINKYSEADLYLFTSYHEGMPTTVLEAMAFGLPVITRPVGGLVDFFEQGKMGEMVNSLKPEDFIPYIEKYLDDSDLVRRTSVYNYQYAKMHFMASSVASQMERIFRACM